MRLHRNVIQSGIKGAAINHGPTWSNEATGKETSNKDRTLPSVAESSEDSVAYEQNTRWCGAVRK